jgi:uncharacterized membrane protein YczE
MKQFYIRLLRLILALILYSLGSVITIRANIGYSPWDVFHAGLTKAIGINIGTATIIVGIIIVAVTVLLGEKLGLGTILNMVLIGIFMDIFLSLNIIPLAGNFTLGVIMLITGQFIIAFATYFYISSGFGTGPRDTLMVALTRISRLPVGVCRGSIEVLAVLAGLKLGGMAGAGTIISALAIGVCVQITFKLFKFDASKVKHETLDQTFKMVIASFSSCCKASQRK